VTKTTNHPLAINDVVKILQREYQLGGELTALPGYCDLNFVLKDENNKRFIVKVSKGSHSSAGAQIESSLEMQNLAMSQLKNAALSVPVVISNLNGKMITKIKRDQTACYYLRILTFLPGSFYSDTSSLTHGPALIMKQEIAEAFVNGMEYFNTFGGNPVSCAIGNAVLKVVQQEQLMKNANDCGHYFIKKLKALQQEFELIGDVRGLGLFIGVEFVEDRQSKQPATEKTARLIEYFKSHDILMTSEGPFYNILKIKPPIVFSVQDADKFVDVLRNGLVFLLKNGTAGSRNETITNRK
jgi:hypothetical protein